MRNTLPIALVVLIASFLGAHALRAQSPQPQPAAPAKAGAADGPLRELYQDRVKAAREVVQAIEQRLEAGEALTPTMVDLQAESFRRLAEAEMAAAADEAGRITAAGQNVRRCEHVLKVVDSRFQAGLDASRIQLSQAKYHLADAKVLLGEAMAAR